MLDEFDLSREDLAAAPVRAGIAERQRIVRRPLTHVRLPPPAGAGLAGSKLERDGRRWFTESPMGRVTFTFAPRNDFGVLDHDVTLPSGMIVYNPLRVISDGEEWEVVFTLGQRPDMTDEDFERDADAVTKDLATLKLVVESL
ncbi:MAG: SRPBCC family protein [Nocardioidaceae bacterium]